MAFTFGPSSCRGENAVASDGHVSVASSLRPNLKKAEAIEIDEHANKKLTRGISRATDNINLVSKARSEFALDFNDTSQVTQLQYFVETPVYTFTLPDLTIYADEFKLFLEKDLIEMSTLFSLEQAGRLNWWVKTGSCQRLWPLATTGDGNCLLHAASLGMWGFHDRLLTLRKALHATLTNGAFRAAIWRRWRWQQMLVNAEAGLTYSEEEWQKEWENLLRLSSTEPRIRQEKTRSNGEPSENMGSMGLMAEVESKPDIYESLEEIHVLALAHVLRRPIIVVADTMLKDVTGEPFAPIPFGGIYLPLECPASECHKSPLVLTYDAAHFSALVAMEKESFADKSPQLPAVIPLIDSEQQLLPIQFAVDPGEDIHWGVDEVDFDTVSRLRLTHQDKIILLYEYLDIVQLPMNDNSQADKKLGGDSFESDDSSSTGDCNQQGVGSKIKAAKQLQFVAKQFGSIGRTMSRKIKKNLGTLTRVGRSNSFKEMSTSCKLKRNLPKGSSAAHLYPKSNSNSDQGALSESDLILAAKLHTEKRHEYQEEMIRNYLHTAHERFERAFRLQQQLGGDVKASANSDAEAFQGSVQCINGDCGMFGTAATSYLCAACYIKQKQQENQLHHKCNHDTDQQCALTQYGAGKSRFYTESDTNMFASIAKMPLVRRHSPGRDRTLYLSKSTFYNDIQYLNSEPSWTNKEKVASYLSSSCTAGASCIGEAIARVPSMNVLPMLMKGPKAMQVTSGTDTHADFSSQVKTSDDSSALSSQPCQTPKCQYFGSKECQFLCSKCYKEKSVKGSNSYLLQLRTTHI